jgi:hypothetical protein
MAKGKVDMLGWNSEESRCDSESGLTANGGKVVVVEVKEGLSLFHAFLHCFCRVMATPHMTFSIRQVSVLAQIPQ